MGRIIVVGEINMDLHLFDVHRSPGEVLLVADHYIAQPGGTGANVARAISRLGMDVLLVGRVGDDEFGHDCLEAIAGDGVDTSAIEITEGTPTGFVVIELDRGRHRSLLLAPGANDALTWSDVESHAAGLTSDDIVVAQAEVPPQTLQHLARTSVEAGAALFLDPTPPERVTTEIISLADVITPNRLEAAALVGRSDSSTLWPWLAAQELLEAGATRVLLKLGEAGAILADADQLLEVPTIDVEPIDETGAGDVFVATLAVTRSEGLDWPEATRMANIASALSLSGRGLHLPRREELDRAAGAAN